MTELTPQYLRELRIQHRNTLDAGLVEMVNQKILKANLSDRTRVEIAFQVDSPWQKVKEHFEGLGFWVGGAGYTEDQYDDDGNEVYYLVFNWHIKAHGNE